MTTLMFAGKELQVTPAREAYNGIRVKYVKLAMAAACDFAENFENYFKNLEELHERCESIVGERYLKPGVEEAIQDLVGKKIIDIDEDVFFEEFLSQRLTWEDDFSEVDNQYLEIVMATEERDAYRTARREGRGKWVGGGFGIEGALKGAATAGAINLLAGLVHGAVNIGAKGVSAVDDMIKKDKIYQSQETRSALQRAVAKVIFDIHFALIDAINTRSSQKIVGSVAESDAKRAGSLLENVRKGRIQENEKLGTILDALSLNPYDDDIYEYIIEWKGDANGELEKIAEYFGVPLVAEYKQSLLEKTRQSLDFSTASGCQSAVRVLGEQAAKIGYIGFDAEKDALLQRASSLELAERSVGDIVYETKSAADSARAEKAARTVNGIEFKTNEEAQKERDKKAVDLGLGVGIFFLPYVFAFATLRKGYSNKVRFLSFAWAIIAVLPFLLSSQGPASAPPVASEKAPTSSPPSDSNANVIAQLPIAKADVQAPPRTDLPFIGSKSFNFSGGSGTGQVITIEANGHVLVKAVGVSGESITYDGNFTNPIKESGGSELLFRENRVYSALDGKIQKGCQSEEQDCVSDLYEVN